METLLTPNETLVLTLNGPYYDAVQSTLTLPIDLTSPVYVFVDVVGEPRYGNVLESHEIEGIATNNILGPVLPGARSLSSEILDHQPRPARTQPGLRLPEH